MTRRYAGECDRRKAVRVDVDLPALWRPCGSAEAPSLAMVFDLSTRGARLAGWMPYEFEVGDCVELRIEPTHVVCAKIARSLGGGEYGVELCEVSTELRALLINTVGSARAGRRERWAHASGDAIPGWVLL